jgi:hypothetical protein
MNKLIVNVETGESIERPFNKEEIEQAKLDAIKEAEYKEELAVKEAARQAVLDKLGLTAEDIAALGL